WRDTPRNPWCSRCRSRRTSNACSACSSRACEMLVDQSDDRRAFADRAADALHRARTHVADGVHARNSRLERRRQPAGSNAGASLAGEYEAMRVAPHAAAIEPIRFRIGADEKEHVANGTNVIDARRRVAPRDRRKASGLVPFEPCELAAA